MNKLNPCPYDSCSCAMDDPCRGCESFNPKAFEDLVVENQKLKRSILSAHPSGMDEKDPFKVLNTLSNDWMSEVMRPPTSPVEFYDGETLRRAIWEDGDSSVGIPDGYVIDEEIAFSDVVEERDKLRTALEWLVNIGHGVSKGGGTPTDNEINEALDAGVKALRSGD